MNILNMLNHEPDIPKMEQDEKDDYDLYWKASLKIYA